MFLAQIESQEIDLHLVAILDAILSYVKMLKYATRATWQMVKTTHVCISNETRVQEQNDRENLKVTSKIQDACQQPFGKMRNFIPNSTN